MIIYKVKEVLNQKGVTPYRLYSDKVLTSPTWENFKKGGDLSLKVLDKLCSYLNCDLDDLVEYAKDDSFEAKCYLIKKHIDESNFDEEFNSLCEEALSMNYIYDLTEAYKDSIDTRQEKEVQGWMHDVLRVEKITRDFEFAVKYAKKHTEIDGRFESLEDIKDLYVELVEDINYPNHADGSLSRLCNLRDNFFFAKVLDVYLDGWREEHIEHDEDDEIVGDDYYEFTSNEIIAKLTDKQFVELVETVSNCFDYEVESFYNDVNNFTENI